MIDVLTKAGVKAIAVHARTTKELYSGEPHFNLLKDYKVKIVKSNNNFFLIILFSPNYL